jgi:hypothetical protein
MKRPNNIRHLDSVADISQIMKLLLCSFLQPPLTSSFFELKYLPSQAVRHHCQSFVSLELKFHLLMKNRQCYNYVNTHPSLSAEVGFQDPFPPAKNENPRIIDSLRLQNHFSMFLWFLFFVVTLSWKPLLFVLSTHSTSYCMARRPVWTAEQFWCSYPLKGLSNVFWLLVTTRICKTAKYQPADGKR